MQTIKKGSSSITEYLQKIKHVADNLAAVACPVDDEDLIIHTLNELPRNYGPFKTYIRTRSSPISVEDLHVVLISIEEMNIDSMHQSSAESTAFMALKGPARRGNFRGSGRFGNCGSGRNYGRNNVSKGNFDNGFSSQSAPQPQSSRSCCQICNRSGHTALGCYHRVDYSYQGRHPPAQLAPMAASSSQATAQNWYTDSGATKTYCT